MTGTGQSAMAEGRKHALIAATLLACAALAAVPLLDIFNRIAYNPNEGWNAFNAALYQFPDKLYPDGNAFTFNNYPPLYFYILGILGNISGDYIFVGRVISLVSITLIAFLIHRISILIAGARSGILLIGPGLFFLYNLTAFRGYFALSDPQWLALLFTTWAMYLLLRSDASGRTDYRLEILAAILVVLGLMIKHNILAMPLSATIWLLFRDRKKFLAWSVAGALTFAGASLILLSVYGDNFVEQVLEHKRTFSMEKMVSFNIIVLKYFILTIPVGIFLFKYYKFSAGISLALISLIISLASGLVQMSGEGVWYNAYFEMLIWICIACPLAIHYAGLHSRPHVGKILILMVFVPFALLIPKTLMADLKYVANHRTELKTWQYMQSAARSAPGPVLCENLAVCYWAGKSNVVDFFNYDQKLKNGEDDSSIRQYLCSGKLSLVILGPQHDDRAVFYDIIGDSFNKSVVMGDFSILIPRDDPVGCPPAA